MLSDSRSYLNLLFCIFWHCCHQWKGPLPGYCQEGVEVQVVPHLTLVDTQRGVLLYCWAGVGVPAPHKASTDTSLAGEGLKGLLPHSVERVSVERVSDSRSKWLSSTRPPSTLNTHHKLRLLPVLLNDQLQVEVSMTSSIQNANLKSRMSPVLLPTGCKSEVPTTLSLGSINLVEWLTELRNPVYSLDYGLIMKYIKGYKSMTKWRDKRHIGWVPE